MGRKKLDLMNNRSQKVQQPCLFDSTEFAAVASSSTERQKGFVNFSSQTDRKDMIDRNKSQKLDSVDKPYKVKGNFKFAEEKPPKESYYDGNIAAQKFYCFKERISSPLMNKVLDREHDVPAESVVDRIEAGLVPGGHWSVSKSVRKPLSVPATDLGPGEYDITRFDSSPQGPGANVIKFNDTPTGRGGLEYEDAPSPTTYSPNYDIGRPRNSIGVIPFNAISRFEHPIYRKPGYVQTSGMSLSPDYDRKLGWEKPDIPVKLNVTGPRLQPPPIPVTTAREARPDYGNKISVATAAATTTRKYSMCFRYYPNLYIGIF